ncbi:hypothetical protein SAY87_022028 [Trapa incisa]|uniref:Uncharacterized protein n=2 Tax=Trapa TaxID=22665 RepID=A0AAN7RJ46_TRANT|nr:hypothetical protein SAY87_022028 [Trapa incisa]KAK4804860.1 hypothetical protein SAY86_004677 [Trapa natans]
MCVGTPERTSLHRLRGVVTVKRRHGRPRVLRHQRRRRRMLRKLKSGKKREAMEMKNLRLFMKNQRIIQENELLREKALLLHQENAELLLLLRNKFSG